MTPNLAKRPSWLPIAVATPLLVGAFIWQTLQITELRREITQLQAESAELRAELAKRAVEAAGSPEENWDPNRKRPVEASGADGFRAAEAGKAMAEASDPNGIAVPSLEQVDEAVQEALARAEVERSETERERLREQGEQYIAGERVRIGDSFDRMVDEGLVEEGDREAALELLIGEQVEAWGLKADVQDGVMTEDEAVAEWRRVHEETATELNELLGYENAQDLLGRTSRAGK